MKQTRISTRWRRLCATLALIPLLQVSACQNVDLSTALSVGLANFTINQSTTAFDTVLRNLLGL